MKNKIIILIYIVLIVLLPEKSITSVMGLILIFASLSLSIYILKWRFVRATVLPVYKPNFYNQLIIGNIFIKPALGFILLGSIGLLVLGIILVSSKTTESNTLYGLSIWFVSHLTLIYEVLIKDNQSKLQNNYKKNVDKAFGEISDFISIQFVESLYVSEEILNFLNSCKKVLNIRDIILDFINVEIYKREYINMKKKGDKEYHYHETHFYDVEKRQFKFICPISFTISEDKHVRSFAEFISSINKNGEFIYLYLSGNTFAKGFFKNDVLDGIVTFYYKNGEKMLELEFSMGDLMTKANVYDEFGSPIFY